MYTKPKYIQLIHIAKQKLGIDELSYRAMLERLTGKSSTKQMTIPELTKVYNELENKGFKKTSRKGKSSSTTQLKTKSNIAKKILALWIDMARKGIIRDGSEKALNVYIMRIVNEVTQRQRPDPKMLYVGFLHTIDNTMATIVVERLKKWQQRVERKNG
ncbi:gp16 family protein [Avibacterium paragallinarum]|uniref:gp16 family protein n=1 Tax=Avibacterium paragallinarum TaxID=728 RepID=UPI003987EE3F